MFIKTTMFNCFTGPIQMKSLIVLLSARISVIFRRVASKHNITWPQGFIHYSVIVLGVKGTILDPPPIYSPTHRQPDRHTRATGSVFVWFRFTFDKEPCVIYFIVLAASRFTDLNAQNNQPVEVQYVKCYVPQHMLSYLDCM